MPVSTRYRRRASKGPSNQQQADCDDLDDEEQFLSLDDVLEGHFNLPTHLFMRLATCSLDKHFASCVPLAQLCPSYTRM